MVSSEGGMDIEQIAEEHPEALRRTGIDPLLGLRPYHARWLTGGLPEDARRGAADIIPKLYEVLIDADATLVEVNPLVLLADGRVAALDSKVTIDDNALYRQEELAELRGSFPVDPTEAKAKEQGLQYVKLDGQVGIIGNGAGLVMSTLDVVAQAGGRPANFLDVGGGGSAAMMATPPGGGLSGPPGRGGFVNTFCGGTPG